MLSLLIIIFSRQIFFPISLAWFDSRYTQVYHLEVVTVDEAVYPLSRGFMAPYDLNFSQARLYFLNPRSLFTNTYGAVSNYDLMTALENARNLDEVERLVAGYNGSEYNLRRQQQFDRFIQTFFANINRDMYRRRGFILPHPVHHIMTHSAPDSYAFQAPVATVRVRYVETYYDGEIIHIVFDEVIHTIDIE